MYLAPFHHVDIGAGLVDEDFRGNLSVLLFNHTQNPFTLSQGDKIAKLICEEMYYHELDLLNKTGRHLAWYSGLGSTEQN
jgi:dUTP pyrophosphatase